MFWKLGEKIDQCLAVWVATKKDRLDWNNLAEALLFSDESEEENGLQMGWL